MKSTIDLSPRKDNSSSLLVVQQQQNQDIVDQQPQQNESNKKKKSGMVPNFLRKKFSSSENGINTSSSNLMYTSSNNLINTSSNNLINTSNQSITTTTTTNKNNNSNNNINSSGGITNSTSNGNISKLVQETSSLSVKVTTPTNNSSNNNNNNNNKKSGSNGNGSGGSSRSSPTNSSTTSGGSSSSSSSYFSSNQSRSNSSSSLSDTSSDSPLSESAELFNRSTNRLHQHLDRASNSNNNGSNHQSGLAVISSLPTTEYSWEVPEGVSLDSIKQLAIADIEHILVVLSDFQKTLGEKTKDSYTIDDDMELDIFDRKCKIRHKVAVMTEILKQFNFGFDSSEQHVDSEFDSLTGGDNEMERKTFLLARKIMNLKLEINKATSIKRAHVLNTIIQCIIKFLKTNICPKEVPSIPLEMTITMGQGSGIQQYLYSTVYKKGLLQKKKNRSLGSKFSNKWIILKHSEILLFSSEKEEHFLGKKSISDLTNISITPQVKEGHPNCFTLSFIESDGASSGGENQDDWNISNNMRQSGGSGRSSKSRNNILFSCENNETLIQWVLAIDGVMHSNFKSVMDLQVKEQLLYTFKSNFKGGIFRFGDEEWHYHDGRLTNQGWDADILEYQWDGCKLTPSKHSKQSLGHGRWNGVWLTWYSDGSKEPYLKYLYQPAQRNYIVDCYPMRGQFTWTWSRHFLVSASGGEWICEGDVPPVLVMLVQMMKYYRVGR